MSRPDPEVASMASAAAMLPSSAQLQLLAQMLQDVTDAVRNGSPLAHLDFLSDTVKLLTSIARECTASERFIAGLVQRDEQTLAQLAQLQSKFTLLTQTAGHG